MNTAKDYLSIAQGILVARGVEYEGTDEERSMAIIVEVFNQLTGRSLSEQEGWLFMVCLKLTRQFAKEEHHEDSSIDLIGYAALLAESFSNAESS